MSSTCGKVKLALVRWIAQFQRLHHLAVFDPADMLLIGVTHLATIPTISRSFERVHLVGLNSRERVPGLTGSVLMRQQAAAWLNRSLVSGLRGCAAG